MADNIGLAVLEECLDTAEVTTISNRGYSGGHPPQNATMPLFTVDVITNVAVEHLGGSSVSIARVRVDAYDTASNQATANNLAETIRTKALKSTHKGALGTTNAMDVREISLAAGPEWQSDPPVDGSDRWRFFSRTDYLLTYIQTGPS